MDRNPEKKYLSLSRYFMNADNETITLTFEEIENIMGQQLPNAAYLNKSWWKKTKPPAKHFHAWMNAGYFVKEVDNGRRVTFVKSEMSSGKSSHQREPSSDILLVRTAEPDDARSFISMQKTVEAESPYMLYEKNERNPSTQQIRKQMTEWKKSTHSTILIAIFNGEHAGYLVLIGNPAKRAAHRASIVLGVLPDFQQKGIGYALLAKAEEWAAQRNISRLELTVVTANEAAVKLYQKTGYETEGIRKNSLFINGFFHDELYMAKLLQ